MGWEPRLRWSEVAGAWRSDVGDKSEKTGRRTPKYFRFDAQGNKIGRGDKRVAKEMLAAFLAERKAQEDALRPDVDNPPVWQLAELYLQWCAEQVARGKLEQRTYEDRNKALTRFQEFSSDRKTKNGLRRARTMQARDLSRWRKALEDATEDSKGRPINGYGSHFITRMLASVKACWSWASDKEREPGPILQTNPFEGVGGPESEEAAERYVDEVQGHALLKFIEDRAEQFDPVSLTGQFERLTALLYRILYESGCRPSELVKAEWSEFSPEARVISLPRQRHKTGKKTKRPRRIPLQAHAVEALLRWRERPGRHPTRIFTHKRGRGSERRGATDPAAGEPWKVGPLGQKFRKLRNAAKKAGLDVCVRDGAGQIPTAKPEITLYDFRRTFTTDAREAGIDAGDAASAQGHRRETADKTYDVPRVQRIVGVSDRVAEKRGRALKGKEQDQEG